MHPTTTAAASKVCIRRFISLPFESLRFVSRFSGALANISHDEAENETEDPTEDKHSDEAFLSRYTDSFHVLFST